ncbi:MAG: hypothetical protein ACOC8B_04125, partial [Gemmatimonadota bacterium]
MRNARPPAAGPYAARPHIRPTGRALATRLANCTSRPAARPTARLEVGLATRLTTGWLAIGLIACVGCIGPAAPLLAQTPPDRFTGTVVNPEDSPVAGANVFLLETLDGD